MKRSFLVSLAFLYLAVCAAAHADEMNLWYGTFTVEQTLSRPSTETFKEGDPYYPGTRTITEDAKWTGTITFMPGKRRVVSGSYVYHYLNDRKTQTTQKCLGSPERTAEYHDYESVERDAQTGGTTEHKSTLSIYIGDDGAYRVHQIFSLPYTKDADKITAISEFYYGCQKAPLKRDVQKSKTGASAPGVTLAAKANAGTLPPQTLQGTDTQYPEPGVTLTFTWNLTRAVPKLTPQIAGPAFFKRGDIITLDASGSQGDITEYKWTFDYGENCVPGVPAQPDLEMKGKQVSFRALCDFRAHLSLKDSTGVGAHATRSFQVQARDGEDWKLKFQAKEGAPLSKRIVAEYSLFGVNRCAKHEFDEKNDDHQIHTESLAGTRTWLRDGYEAEKVDDAGPFNGFWWVTKQKLEIDRVARVNSSLLPGGELATLNASKGNARDLSALAAAVKAHEALHSSLAKEALDQLGEKEDPARQIEAQLGPSEEVLQIFADMKIRDVETKLREATSEANVKARMQGQSAFQTPVKIWMPTLSGDAVQKDLGPLWSIGE